MTTIKNDAYIAAARKALASAPRVYAKRNGQRIRAMRADDLNKLLREQRWKNNSSLNVSDYGEAGFTITEAQYVGGARPTGQFVAVVVEEA